jgi:hypothetical protein
MINTSIREEREGSCVSFVGDCLDISFLFLQIKLIMSITTESTESTQTYIEERIDDTKNAVDTHNQTLVIVLTVTLSTLAVIAIIITAIIIHRRRYSSTFHLKKLRNSSRLQQIVVNLSPTLIRLQYD